MRNQNIEISSHRSRSKSFLSNIRIDDFGIEGSTSANAFIAMPMLLLTEIAIHLISSGAIWVFARYIRGHGFSSGLGSNNVDDYCVLGELVSREDVLAISRREKPRVPVILKVALCFSERKMQKDSKESGRWFRDIRPQSQTNTNN